MSESIYYCDIWDRNDGSHWFLNTALFFDQSGRLYKVGAGQSDTGVAGTAAFSANANATRHSETVDVPSTGTDSAGNPQRTSVTDESFSAEQLPAGRQGRRTPFTNPDSLR